MAPPPPHRVGVIGGGIAGLSCARRLGELGKEVVLFDTGKRSPAGRASSRLWIDRRPVDHAAQFTSASTSEYAALLARLEEEGAVRRFRGRVGTLFAPRSAGEQPSFVVCERSRHGFDALVIAHNGKCAQRLTSPGGRQPALALHALLRAKFGAELPNPRRGGGMMQLNSIYS
ncbi:MAG: hypothetical protein SGPRY_003139, partial [Prymnesium sp.]